MAPARAQHPGTAVLAELYAAIGQPGYAAVAQHSTFAAEKSVTKSTVSNVLTGKTKPQPSTVDAIIAACLDYASKHPRSVTLGPLDFRHWHDRYWRAVEAADAAKQAAIDPVLGGYLEQARSQFHLVQLETLTPLSDQDEHLKMGLGEVFIAQSVRENPPPVDLPREVWRRLVERGHLRDDDLPTGFDRTSLDRLHQAYQQRKPKPVLTVLAQPSVTRLVLLGDPGSGKSTLARYLALTLAGGASLPDELVPLAGVPPIVIELRVYISNTWGEGDFLDLLDYQHTQEGFGLPRKTAQSLLASGPTLVVFDGLDEVFDPAQRDAISRKIAGFATRYPLARIVATSRVVGYHRAILDTAGFAHYKLEDLDRGQIGTFVHQWYATAYPGDEREAKRLHDRLLTAIDNARPVAELAGNPMLLTILAIISRRRELPRDRREVYDHAVTVLVEHWDISKHLADRRIDQGMPYIDRRAKVELLQQVARRMQDAPAGLTGNHIPGQDLTEEFEKYLHDTYELPKDRAKTVANAMLDQFQQRNFILSRFGTGVYGFVHRAFLEYLAADDIVQRFGRRRMLSEQDLIDIFTCRWSDPAWHEVLRHVAGMLEEEFVAPVIDHLLDLNPTWRQSATALPNHLVLAVQCLGEVRRLGMLTQQSTRVATAITDMLVVAAVRHRQYDTELVELIEQRVLPVLSAFSQHWAGAETYRTWFATERNNLARRSGRRPPVVLNLATRIRVVLRGDDQQFHEHLLAQLASPVPALRISAISGLAALSMDDESVVNELGRIAEIDVHARVRLAAVEALGQNCANDHVRDLLMRRAETDSDSDVRVTSIQLVTADRPHPPAVADWLHQLAAHAPHDRSAVIAAMDVENADLDLLNWLQDRVHDLTDQVRSAAVSAIATGWATDPAVYQWLRELAEQAPDADVRDSALRAVAEHRRQEPGILSWLLDRARLDIASRVRTTVIDILNDSWLSNTDVVDWLRDQVTSGRDRAIRSAALRVVGPVSQTRDTQEWLQKVATSGGDWYVRDDAIQLVAQRWGTEPDIQSWLHTVAVDDPDGLVRRATISELLRYTMTDDTPTWLTRIAETDTDEYVRTGAIESIVAAWLERPETSSWLQKRLAIDPAEDVRSAIIEAMASSALVSSTDSSPTEVLDYLRDIAQRDILIGVRCSTIGLISEWFVNEPGVEPWLREIASKDRHPEVRSTAIRELVATFVPNAENYEWLRRIATADMSYEVRGTAISEISTRWRHVPEALSWLKEIIAREHDPELRRYIINIMAAPWNINNWGSEPSVVDWLVVVAESDRDSIVRAAAISAVADCRVQQPGTLDWLTDRLASDPDDQARAAVVSAIHRRWPAHDTKPLLENSAFTDESDQVRAEAVAAIADRRGHMNGMLDELKRIATTDPHQGVRERAIDKIVDGWCQALATLDWVRTVATSDANGTVRAAAISHIGHSWPNHPEIHDWLRRQATDNSESLARASAIRQLGRGWANRADTLSWLREVGEADQDMLVRIAAIEVIAKYGALDPTTPTWLRDRVTADENPTVQAFAVVPAVETGQLLPDTPNWLRGVVATGAHWHCRSIAVEALAVAWSHDHDGLNWLRQVANNDRDPMVRSLAIEMTALCWAHEPEVVDWLKNLAVNDGAGVVCAVIRTVAATLPFDEDTVPWLQTFTTKQDEAVRRTALRELEHLGAGNPDPDR